MQGAFGALTVTMKLYPAIVTLHLLGGLVLLALLAIQAERYAPRAAARCRRALRARRWSSVAALTVVQIALGGWVSTNYAVLACSDFPTCQGSWWPPMDFAQGFALLARARRDGDGGYLPFAALTAIHYGAPPAALLVLLPALGALAWRLHARRRRGAAVGARACSASSLLAAGERPGQRPARLAAGGRGRAHRRRGRAGRGADGAARAQRAAARGAVAASTPAARAALAS